MFKKILVPFTGSSVTKQAFDTAINLAKKYDASINVLACVEEYRTFGFQTKHDKKITEYRKQQIQKQIEELKNKAEKNKISFKSTIMKSEFPQKCIVKYANENNSELIIMGKTNLAPAEKYHHQSTINYVYPQTNCPILIIK